MAAFTTMPLLGHEAGIEQDAEVLGDGRPAHLQMSRKRVDAAGGLDEEVEHPAPCRMADCCEDVGLAIGKHHHAANIRKRFLSWQAKLSFAKGIGRSKLPKCEPVSFHERNRLVKFGCKLGKALKTTKEDSDTHLSRWPSLPAAG